MKRKHVTGILVSAISLSILSSCAFLQGITDGIKDITKVSSITLNAAEKELNVGDTFQLAAKVLPLTAYEPKVEWSSEVDTVATVNKTGLVKAKAAGTTNILAKSIDGTNIVAKCKITVTKVDVTGLELDVSEKEINFDETFTINATVLPANASNKDITWTSSNVAVATVNKGTVKGITIGEATIKATTVDGGFTKEVKVTVTAPKVRGVSLDKTTLTIAEEQTSTLVATVLPANAPNKSVVWSSLDESIAKVSNKGVVTGVKEGKTTIKVTTVEEGYEATCEVTVLKKGSVTKEDLKYTIKDYAEYNLYPIDYAPNLDKLNLLVIPVWFTDSNKYISTAAKKAQVKEDIETAYFGTNEETGWRSVKSYYEEESEGKVEFDGVVTDWFECGYASSKFHTDSEATTNLVLEAVEWYKTSKGLSNLKDFDCDDNGFLDGVMLIYGAPDYATAGTQNSNMWAYCYWVQDYDALNVSNPGANVFFWASYDFMYGDNLISKYHAGDTRYCNIDAHTYIHEMGHVFGLEDYYDYGGDYNPAGGFSMQDMNVGGHDPYSVLTYGWTSPYVPKTSCEITINNFTDSKDVILLSPSFTGSPFDEYLLLELYSPTGLNEFDSLHQYIKKYPTGPATSGIRLWHVDSRLVKVTSLDTNGYPVYTASNIITNPQIDFNKCYGVELAFSNTYNDEDYMTQLGSKYKDYNVLQLIRNSTIETYRPTSYFTASSLFTAGDTFTMSKYKSQFVKGDKLNTGNSLGFSFTVKEIKNGQATIQIIKE